MRNVYIIKLQLSIFDYIRLKCSYSTYVCRLIFSSNLPDLHTCLVLTCNHDTSDIMLNAVRRYSYLFPCWSLRRLVHSGLHRSYHPGHIPRHDDLRARDP